MADKRWIESANVRVTSDGSLPNTHVYLVEDDKQTEIFPVTHVSWHMDVDRRDQETFLTIGIAQADLTIPAKLVEFVTEPKFTISDVTPWYARLLLWLKAKNTEMKRRERG